MISFAVLIVVLIGPSEMKQISTALISPDWPFFVVLGVLGAGISFVLYIIGLNHTSPTVASIVATVEPVTAARY